MSTIALTNAAGGERVQETVEIVTPLEEYVVPKNIPTTNSDPTTIGELCKDLAKGSINLRPIYQRSYKWLINKFILYITHVWKSSMVQTLTLYELSTVELLGLTDDADKYVHECIDGQHRMAALKHFYESSPINELSSKDKMVYIDVKDIKGNPIALFYRETQHTIEWAREKKRPVMYMYANPDAKTPDIEKPQTNDCNRFNNIVVQMQTYTSPLSKSYRKRIFLDLQQGVPVKGDDLYRNLDAPLVVKLDETRNLYIETVIPHITTKPLQYITHAQVRYCKLSSMHGDTPEVQADKMFKSLRDADIKNQLERFIKNGHINHDSLLKCEDAEVAKYDIDMQRLIKFCKSLPPKTKLSPILMIAIYAHFSKMDDATYDSKLPIIVSWMAKTNVLNPDNFMVNVKHEIKTKHPNMVDLDKIETLWEKTTHDAETIQLKCEIYCEASKILQGYDAMHVIVKKPARKVTPQQKKSVAADQGWKCNVCDVKLTKNYEVDHIKPLRGGGDNDDANLQALCCECHATKTHGRGM